MQYCVQERVINYGQESEALSHTRYAVDDRLEEARRNYAAASALRKCWMKRWTSVQLSFVITPIYSKS